MAAQPITPGQPMVAPSTVPIPDPTLLTTQAYEKADDNLRSLLKARLDAFEKEVLRLRDELDKRPAAVLQEVGHLKELMTEKFRGVEQQFTGRDTALTAALSAQKLSVEEQNKSNAASSSKVEAAITKQIDGIQAIIVTQTKASDDKISDLKDRLTAIDGRTAGGKDVWGYIVGGFGVLAVLVTLVIELRPSSPSQTPVYQVNPVNVPSPAVR